jgi:hypothetical protein
VEARDYSMCIDVLQQIKTFGIVPGSGFVDYVQSLTKQNKHKNSPCNCTTAFHGKDFPPQLSNTYKELCINVLFVYK